MISPLPLEDSEDPDDVSLLCVVGHGIHDGVPDHVLHQLSAAQVLGAVTVGTLLWDLDQHLNVLLRDPVNLQLHVAHLSAAMNTGKMVKTEEAETHSNGYIKRSKSQLNLTKYSLVITI